MASESTPAVQSSVLVRDDLEEILHKGNCSAQLNTLLGGSANAVSDLIRYHTHLLREVDLTSPSTTLEKHLAVLTETSLLLCRMKTPKQGSDRSEPRIRKSLEHGLNGLDSLWDLDVQYELLAIEVALVTADFEDTIKIRGDRGCRSFVSTSATPISRLVDQVQTQQATNSKQASRPRTAPGKFPQSLSANDLQSVSLVEELFSVRQIVRNGANKIVRGTITGLCRQILLEKIPVEVSSSLSSVLLRTIGLWADTEVIIKELCNQLEVLADSATRGRPAQIVRLLLRNAPSLLLESRNVEMLLNLVNYAEKEDQTELKDTLWTRRSSLLAVITMDMSQQNSPASYRSERSWMAEYQSLSQSGLQAESILAIPANLFAAQLHIFHRYYLKRWNPAQDQALFFNTVSKGASRNPLIFSPRRMHFLTNTILSHILGLEARPVSTAQRAAIATQWILIGMMLKRIGDMTGWLATLMALCAPSVVRLKAMWSVIELRLQLVVEKEWSPVMRDLFRRSIGAESSEKVSAHVLAPDATGLSLSTQDIVPFYGDLCDAIEEVRARAIVLNANNNASSINVETLEDGEHLLSTALASYQLFVHEAHLEPQDVDDNDESVVPAFQDCFKQLNSLPAEVLDVCSPTLLTASIRCEPPRIEDLTSRKEKAMYTLGTGAFVPLVFNDTLPSYRLFEASVLLDMNDPTKRPKMHTNVSNSKIATTGSVPMRRLNSFPPTKHPASYTTGHGYLDETTRARAAASVSQWKMLRHVKDIAGVSDRLIWFKPGTLVLKDLESSEEQSRRRPQSAIMEARKRDSTISRRSSLQFTDGAPGEQDEDLVIKPQKYTPLRKRGSRELVVKAATLDTMIDLLVLNLNDINILEIYSPSKDSPQVKEILLDRPDFLRTFLVSYRSYCTSSVLMNGLCTRLMKAIPVSCKHNARFPEWSEEDSGIEEPHLIDWSLAEKVYTGVFEAISCWLNLAPKDFTGSAELCSLLDKFLAVSEQQIMKLESMNGTSAAPVVCKELCLSHLRRIRKQILRVFHRPQAWTITSHADHKWEIYEPFSVARLVTTEDACTAIKQLDLIVESVLQAVTLEDWMECYELFENQAIDPKGYLQNIHELVALDNEIPIHDSIWLLATTTTTNSHATLLEAMPLPIRNLVQLRNNITNWTVMQLCDPMLPLDARVHKMQIFLKLIAICGINMSSLDIKVSSEALVTTQIVPSFIATSISAGLINPHSRQFAFAWHIVGQNAGTSDASGSLSSLMPKVTVDEPHIPLVPCLAWLCDRMLEVACYVPDRVIERPGLLNFDKRRYILNLLSNLDLVSCAGHGGSVLDEVDNPFLFVLAKSSPEFDIKSSKSVAHRENQLARNVRISRAFSQIVSLEHEKARRDIRHRELIDKQIREVQKATERKRLDAFRQQDQLKRPSTKSKYGMNSLLRAVRPISVAISGNWTPDKHSGFARIVPPQDLPSSCIIPKGTKPALTIDLVHSTTNVHDSDHNIFRVRSEDGLETFFQAVSRDDMEHWVKQLTFVSVDGAQKRRRIIRQDARLAHIEEAPQFSPRNSTGVNITTATFGIDLPLLVRREGSSIPSIATMLIEEIESRGLQEVGIYRISGSLTTVTALKRAFDSGGPVNLADERWSDINAIAGAFKLWLRELPEPLMTYTLYDSFLNTLSIEDHAAKSLALKELIHRLPVPNFSMLKRLIEHLEKITDYEATNHMYAHNLAIVFGPNVLQPIPSAMSFASSMNDLGKVQTIIRNIILQCHWIFSTDEVEDTILSPKQSMSPLLSAIQENQDDGVEVEA